MLEWISNANNATVVQAVAAAVQAGAALVQTIFGIALFALTYATVRLTRRIVAETAASAAATRAAVNEAARSREQAREQFIRDAAPVVTITVDPPANNPFTWGHDDFNVVVRNVGRGPALDLNIAAHGSGQRYNLTARAKTPAD